ncbi:MAG: type IV pilus assembly protein PilM [Planctomycetota bacterium]|jgi:type IV pilus assembly protein PilM
MARLKAAWGMEVGAAAIKAIRLERDGDRVTVTDFAVVPHRKVLSTPDVDQDDMTRLSLGQFISQKALEGEHLVVSVPGHAAFARFAKLPPVEPKKVPDIVKFEAVQQIPFPIDQVEWDYQTFTDADSPEVEVGIFAITRDRVKQRLGLYAELGITPASLTLSPVAVYNAMAYDHELSERKGPVIYLDIGTYATDVVVAEQGRCWIRTFPLGGTHFTEAIANAFKLSYTKADKLKHEAASSKYAKQIMQAMRPVFSDLLQDLQRSIGYYQTLHRDAQLSTMVGLGSTFKIPGLRKFLGQQLQMQVMRLDEYKRITVTGREAATFAQNTVSIATAYGLALQGVGLARITANLVPVETVRAQLWHQKTKWFAGAAAVVALGAGMMLYRPISDRGAVNPEEPPAVTQVLAHGGKLQREYEQLTGKSRVGHTSENLRRFMDNRRVWPYLMHDAAEALASTDPQPELLGDNVVQIKAVPPQERRLVQLSHLDGIYDYQTDTNSRRILVRMDVRLSHEQPIEFLNGTVGKWLRDNAEREGVPYRILADTISYNPGDNQTWRVEETGDQVETGTARPTGRQGGTPPPSGRRERERPRTPPAPPPPDAGSGSTGGFGAGGGPDTGRRKRDKGKRDAPGKGGSGFGIGGGGGQAPPRTGDRDVPRLPDRGGFPSRGSRSGRSGARSGEHGDLEALGPVPDRPSLYPPDSKYYVVPITFEVELVDERAPAAAARTVARGLDKDPAS